MKRILIALCLFAAYFAAVYGLMPFHDDWSYATAPNPDFTWSQLLPSLAFWRPFDVLWGALMVKCPGFFPGANRLVVVLAHTLNVFIVGKILERMPGDGVSRWIGTLFFALSPSVAALVVNSDTINQAWSFTFGAAALLVALSDDSSKGRKGIVVTVLLFLSLLFKESGVSWLAVIPLVSWLKTGDVRKSARLTIAGGVLLAVYFCVRFCLLGACALGDGQYYALGFNPESILINLALSIVASLSAIDILAFVYDNWLLLLASGALSVSFFAFWFASADRRRSAESCIIAALVAIAMAIPHCCFVSHHPAEMHFYPILFAGALMLAAQPSDARKKVFRFCSVGAMCLIFGIGWSDKMRHTYAHSRRVRVLFEELKSEKLDYSKPIYFIVDADRTIRYYSVFSHSAAHGLDCGRACRAFNGWHNFDYHMAYTMEERMKIPVGVQVVRIK